MSLFDKLKTFTLPQRQGLDFQQIEAILDVFPQAVFFVDRNSNTVLLTNARATELTACTRTELRNKRMGDILPEYPEILDQLNLENPSKHLKTVALTRSGSEVEVVVERVPIRDSWALITIEPKENKIREKDEWGLAGEHWRALHDLTASVNVVDMGNAIQQAIQAGQRLTGADTIAIYQLEPQEPLIKRVAGTGSADLLPEVFESLDLGRLRSANLWTPGKHPTSEIHRGARSAGFAYVLTLPLGEPRAILGLLAIGDRKNPPTEPLLPIAQVIEMVVSSMMQVNTLVLNLKETIYNQQSDLALGQTVKEGVEDGVIELDPNLTITQLNTAAELILSYATQEVKGQPFQNILIGTNTLIPALRAAQDGTATLNLGNIRLHRRDGQAFQAHVRTLPVKVDGRVEKIIILFQDLSEHEQFKVQTQQLEQRALLGEVTAIFAHEVRNPINNISTGLQLLTMKIPEDDPKQEVLERLQQDCNRLEHLMKSVLDFSRTAEYNMEPVDLEDLIERLLNRWRPRMTRVNIKPHIQVQAGTPPVHADRRALEQVFTNLISNAVQAMKEEGGTLAIQTSLPDSKRERQRVFVNISDTGPGIPDEIRDRIFEPFFTTNPEGTGLGLAITRRIITAHKGTITVNSFPGGTVFQIQLPLSENTPPSEE